MNDSITTKNINHLIDRLAEQGVVVSPDEVRYSLMNREEWIYIQPALTGLYPTPGAAHQFGIYIDSDRREMLTDVSMLKGSNQTRAKELLKLFSQTYHDIVADVNSELNIKG